MNPKRNTNFTILETSSPLEGLFQNTIPAKQEVSNKSLKQPFLTL